MNVVRPLVQRTCQTCGTEFLAHPYQIVERGVGKYCSCKCANSGPAHPRWKGGRLVSDSGYVFIHMPDHPRSHRRYVQEHILIAEKALGRFLPSGAVIHHANEDRADNRPENLVICEDANYHKLLHVRLRVVAVGGDPNTQRPCQRCKTILPIDQFYPSKRRIDGIFGTCKECSRAIARKAAHQ